MTRVGSQRHSKKKRGKGDLTECTPSMYLDYALLWPDDGCNTAETCCLEVNYIIFFSNF
jgi:hypothetical protein